MTYCAARGTLQLSSYDHLLVDLPRQSLLLCLSPGKCVISASIATIMVIYSAYRRKAHREQRFVQSCPPWAKPWLTQTQWCNAGYICSLATLPKGAWAICGQQRSCHSIPSFANAIDLCRDRIHQRMLLPSRPQLAGFFVCSFYESHHRNCHLLL